MAIDRQEFFDRYGRFPSGGGGRGYVRVRTQNVTMRLSKIEEALGSAGLKQLGEAGVKIAEEAMRTAFATERDPVNNRRWAPRQQKRGGKPLLEGLGSGAIATYRVWRGKLRVSQRAPTGMWPGSRKTQAALLFIHRYGVRRRLHSGAISPGMSRSAVRYLRESEGASVGLPKRRSFGISRKKKLELKELAMQIVREAINR